MSEDSIIVNGAALELTHHERMKQSLESREAYVEKMFDAMDSNEPFEDYEDASDAFYELPIGIDIKKIVKIHLSTGGPGDWLEVEVSEIRDMIEIDRVDYHFTDWFQHDQMKVYPNSPLYRYAEQTVDTLLFN